MEGYGFIQSWEVWRNYYDKRNDTSYEYNKAKANEILKLIDNLTADSTYLYEQIEKVLDK